ncbi:MAG: alpha/beta hydrolase [Desulfurococcales archaeon]|nr:alpha/beta hydrolase [Desulfurococcales archaeon]
MKGRRVLLVLALLVLVLFVVIPVYVAYSSIHPARCSTGKTPMDYGMTYTNFTVTTSDGVSIRGWIIPGKLNTTYYIIMHGYTSCKSSEGLLKVAKGLNALGYPVVMFDFRAHGESGGGYTTIGPKEVLDAEAVMDYVAGELEADRLVLVGYSMGASVALIAGAGDERVAGIAADSPYYRLDQVIPRWIGAKTPLPSWYGVLIGFYGSLLTGEDTSFGPAMLGNITKPIIIFYGTQDPLITYEEAKDLVSKSPCGRLVVGKGAGHVEVAEKIGYNTYIELLASLAGARC